MADVLLYGSTDALSLVEGDEDKLRRIIRALHHKDDSNKHLLELLEAQKQERRLEASRATDERLQLNARHRELENAWEQQLALVEQQRQELRKELESASLQLKDALENLKTSETKSTSLAVQVQSLQQRLEAATAAAQTASAQADGALREASDLKELLHRSDDVRKGLERVSRESKSKAERAKSELKELRIIEHSAREALQAKLDQATSQLELSARLHDERLQEAEKRYRRLEEKLMLRDEQYEKLNDLHRAREIENVRLTQANEDLKSSVDSAFKRLHDHEVSREELVASHSAVVLQLRKDLAGSEEEAERLRATLRGLRAELDDQKQETSLSQRQANLELERSSRLNEDRLQEAERRCQKLEEKLHLKEEQVERLHDVARSKDGELLRALQANEELKSSVDSALKKLHDHEVSRDELVASHSSLVRQLRADSAGHEEEAEKLRSALRGLRAELEEQRSEHSKLQQEATLQLETSMRHSDERLEEAEQRHKMLEEKLNLKEREMEEIRETVRLKEAEIERIRESERAKEVEQLRLIQERLLLREPVQALPEPSHAQDAERLRLIQVNEELKASIESVLQKLHDQEVSKEELVASQASLVLQLKRDLAGCEEEAERLRAALRGLKLDIDDRQREPTMLTQKVLEPLRSEPAPRVLEPRAPTPPNLIPEPVALPLPPASSSPSASPILSQQQQQQQQQHQQRLAYEPLANRRHVVEPVAEPIVSPIVPGDFSPRSPARSPRNPLGPGPGPGPGLGPGLGPSAGVEEMIQSFQDLAAELRQRLSAFLLELTPPGVREAEVIFAETLGQLRRGFGRMLHAMFFYYQKVRAFIPGELLEFAKLEGQDPMVPFYLLPYKVGRSAMRSPRRLTEQSPNASFASRAWIEQQLEELESSIPLQAAESSIELPCFLAELLCVYRVVVSESFAGHLSAALKDRFEILIVDCLTIFMSAWRPAPEQGDESETSTPGQSPRPFGSPTNRRLRLGPEPVIRRYLGTSHDFVNSRGTAVEADE